MLLGGDDVGSCVWSGMDTFQSAPSCGRMQATKPAQALAALLAASTLVGDLRALRCFGVFVGFQRAGLFFRYLRLQNACKKKLDCAPLAAEAGTLI